MLCVVVFSVVARYPVDLLYYYFSINNIFLVVCYSHKIIPASHLSSIYLYFLSCKAYFFICSPNAFYYFKSARGLFAS